jgi:tetratricopeptide (TPR) repeat protein
MSNEREDRRRERIPSADLEAEATRTRTEQTAPDGHRAAEPDVSLIGTILLDRYRIDAVLGRGAMGQVYQARDLELERDVAVKLLAGGQLAPHRCERLLREARAAAALNHPHIVAVYDIGEDQGRPFIVMEVVAGGNLREYRPTALQQVVEIAVQLCEALEHAHGHGVVHRDLKPENVLIAGANDPPLVKLADLGVALSRQSKRLTREGAIVGTAAYLAPEQALGQELDGRADLYSLGVVLYELVTGRLPFTGEDPLAVISQHLHAPVVPPRSFRPDLSPTLESIILRLLAKDREGRFASAQEVADVLRSLPEQQAVDAPVSASAVLLEELVRGRLVARERELQQLRELWHRAAEGRGHLALISGEPGAGKTRLARELTVQARLEGATVLSGGCYEYEATTPYLPFVEALRQWVRGESPESLRELTATTAPELVKLAPEIGARLGPFPEPPPLGSHEQRLRLFDHLARFLQELAARRGVLLFLDDLHWADQGTIALLRYLLRQLRGDRLLVVGAYREMELDRVHPLSAALVDWNRERLATRVHVGRLRFEGTRELLATLLCQRSLSTEFAEVVHRETEGNPFFIEELLKALIDQGQIYRKDGEWNRRDIAELTIPQSVKDAIGRRLDRLDPCCIEVLQVASALGKTFGFGELRVAASGRDEEELLDALDAANRAQLVVSRGSEEFAFTHDKIREVLYLELNPVRRRRLHLSVAEGLERLHQKGGDSEAQALAHHFLEAGELERGMRYAVTAAEEAERVFAHDEAFQFYDRARECAQELSRKDEEAKIEEAMGEVCAKSGESRVAGEHLERALALTTSPEKRLELRCRIGELYARIGHARGQQLLRAVMEELDPDRRPLELARATTALGRYHHYRGHHRRAAELMERALRLGGSLSTAETLGTIYSYLAGAYQHRADFGESNAWARRTIQVGEEQNHPYSVALGHEFLAENCNSQGRWSEALRHAERDFEIARKIHSQEREGWSIFCRGQALHGLGRLQDADESLRDGLELAERIGEQRLAILLGSERSMVRADLGETTTAREIGDRSLEQAETLGLIWGRLESRRALAHLESLLGNWQAVIELGKQCEALLEGSDARQSPILIGPLVVAALIREGRFDEAEAKLVGILELAGGVDSELREALARCARGQLRAARGNAEAGLEDIDAVVSALDGLESPIDLGRVLMVRAALRTPDAARSDLERALFLFEKHGAALDRERASVLLH